jgi:8-oxo-dGTP pyrophosphatase MutT (NUDIX family)
MIKYAIAAVIRNERGEFLAVKRRSDENEHPNMWGLPALSFKPPELPENALFRLAKEKLSCEIIPIAFLGSIFQKRPSYNIFLMLYEAKVSKGEPNVKITGKYADQVWTRDPSILIPIANKGSACAQLFLLNLGFIKEEDLIIEVKKEMLEN